MNGLTENISDDSASNFKLSFDSNHSLSIEFDVHQNELAEKKINNFVVDMPPRKGIDLISTEDEINTNKNELLK